MNDSKTDRNRKSKQRDFDAMDWVRDDLGGTLPPELHHMMLYLALCSDGNHECWPKQETIANNFGLKCRQTVAKRLDKLENLGLISRKRRRNTSTLITLNVGATPGCEPALTSGCNFQSTSGCESQINLKGNKGSSSKEGAMITVANAPGTKLPEKAKVLPEKKKKEKGAAKSPDAANCKNPSELKEALKFWHSTMRVNGYESEGMLDGWQLEPLMTLWRATDGRDYIAWCLARIPQDEETEVTPRLLLENVGYFMNEGFASAHKMKAQEAAA